MEVNGNNETITTTMTSSDDTTSSSFIYINTGDTNHSETYNLGDANSTESFLLNNENSTISKLHKFSSTAVPMPSNVDDIFQLLSQKIAKYCQVLADLTNCEVFYKAQLPLNNSYRTEANTKYSRKSLSSLKHRSLYWGTHRMIFEYSHSNGIRYDKSGADSLIKINQRSNSSDVNDLIEEILNGPQNMNKLISQKPNTSSKTISFVSNKSSKKQSKNICSKNIKISTEKNNHNNDLKELKFKDCCVYLNKLDESIVDTYLNKLEQKTNNEVNIENDLVILPSEEELYSDDIKIQSCEKKLQISLNDIDESQQDDDEDCYVCDLCMNVSFKHLTQLKLHDLKHHNSKFFSKQLLINNALNECPKCKYNLFENKIDLVKHLLVCYYPDIFTCKTCSQSFDTYKQYLIHTKYVHTQLVYMCSNCNRKFKNVKDLFDHDQLMHTKMFNYCEICGEALKSRHDLYEHYRIFHMNSDDEYDDSSNDAKLLTKVQLDDQPILEHDECINLTKDEIHLDQNQNPKTTTISLHDDLNALEAVLLNTPPTTSSNNINLDNLIIDQNNNSIAPTSTNTIVFLNNDEIDEQDSKILDMSSSSSFSSSSSTSTSTSSLTIPSNNNSNSCNNNPPSKMKLQKNDLIRGLIDRKHQCKWCSLRFYTKSQLKAHEVTHNNAVLNCPVCDKEFHHKDRLSGHMKCHMEPSLECKVCGKKFKRLCNLYNHELVHGLTEHAFMLCQFCGRGFRSRRDYQNHVIANHRELIMKYEEENSEIEHENANQQSSQHLNEETSVNKSSSSSKRKNASQNVNTKNNKPILKMRKNSINKLQITPQTTLLNHHPQVTTVVLRDEHENMSDIDVISHNNNEETYFTRTGVIQLNKDDIIDIEEEESEENANGVFNVCNILNENSDSNNSNIKKKCNTRIKNKIKRLKSSLNVEVVDDDGDDAIYLQENFKNKSTNHNTQTSNTVLHLVSLSDSVS